MEYPIGGSCPVCGEQYGHADDCSQKPPASAWSDEPPKVPAYEEKAARFRAGQVLGDGKPQGTPESLARCATMLDEYAPDLYPANKEGQVHFARAMMESVADEIRAFLSHQPVAPPLP